MLGKSGASVDENVVKIVAERIALFPLEFQELYKAKLNNVKTLSQRKMITDPIHNLIFKELDALDKRLLEFNKPKEKTKSEKVSELIEATGKENELLNAAMKDEVLKFADDIVASLVDTEYGCLVLKELANIINANAVEFPVIEDFLCKLDRAQLSVDKESLLLFMDMCANNFEYFDYSSWSKITSDSLNDVRNNVSELLKKIMCDATGLITEGMEERDCAEFQRKLVIQTGDSTWLPAKIVDKNQQVDLDRKLALQSFRETFYYYSSAIERDLPKRLTADESKKELLNGAIIRNLNSVKQIVLNNPDQIKTLLSSYYDRTHILSMLMQAAPNSNEVMQIVLGQLREIVETSLNTRRVLGVMDSIRLVPMAVAYLHKPEYSNGELLFLRKVARGFFSLEELRVMSCSTLCEFAGYDFKIKILQHFSGPSDKMFLQNLYSEDRSKFSVIMSSEVLGCLANRTLSVGNLKSWDANKIKSITYMMSNIPALKSTDVGLLSELYNNSPAKFNKLYEGNVKEALIGGYCTLKEFNSINSDQRCDALFHNNVLKGHRLGLIRFKDLNQLHINDIRLLTHFNSIAAMQYGDVTFEKLFTTLRNNRNKFFYLINDESIVDYRHGVSFEVKSTAFHSSTKRSFQGQHELRKRSNVSQSLGGF
jgi:hypothetical protein